MNRKLSILIVVLLLAGAVAIAIVKSREGGASAGTGDGGNSPAGATANPGAGGSTGTGATADSKVSDRSAREVRDIDLVEKYGSARTNLSRKISTDVISLLDDAMEMGEKMSEFGGGRMRSMAALRGTGIKLTEEQQQKVSDLFNAHQQKEMETARTAIDAIRKNPTSLMELFLAGDAKERGEMSDEEYAQLQASAGEELMGIINPLDRNNFRGGRPMEDEEFRNEFLAILDEEQARQFNTKQAEREAERAARQAEREAEQANPAQALSEIPDGNISNIPTMTLETLDETIGSAKQVTSGLKQMMEGMGNLRNLQPQIEGIGETPPE